MCRSGSPMARVSDTDVRHRASIFTWGAAKAASIRGARATVVGNGRAAGPVSAGPGSGATVAGLPLLTLVSSRSVCRMPSAFRTAPRSTPNSWASLAWVGMRWPGRSSPDLIRVRRASATAWCDLWGSTTKPYNFPPSLWSSSEGGYETPPSGDKYSEVGDQLQEHGGTFQWLAANSSPEGSLELARHHHDRNGGRLKSES